MRKTLIAFVFVVVVSPLVIWAQGGKLVLPGLKSEVTARRDTRGIPYIEALNDADLYFAQGYITASDRLWQMDLMRRLARGETAEIFGAQGLEQDKRWRRFGFGEVANQSLGQLSPELRQALNDYTRGVNAYIASLDDKSLPVEFRILQYKPRQWAATDTLVIGKILADALSTTWQNDVLRATLQKSLSPQKFADLNGQVTPYDVLLVGKDAGATRGEMAANVEASAHLTADAKSDADIRAQGLASVGLYAEDLAASNNWVISGKRTADGKPILANDPHLAPTAPGIWYLSHLSTPSMRVSGVTVPGVPGIILGHNEFIAWGATNVGPDVQDVYEETFNETGEYKTPTGWQKPTVRHETINVRGNVLTVGTTPTTFDVTETRNGVIVSEENGKKYALKWTARDPKNQEFEAFFGLNRAKNWDEFKNALKTYGGATQNFVYADVKGPIGWYAAGKIPLRRKGDGSYPYDGSTSDGDWVGYIPFEELPNLYDPPSGLIVTANQRTVGTDYKYYPQFARDIAMPWRARRITELLNPKTKITMDDVRDVQYDVFSIPLDMFAKAVAKSGNVSPETLAVLKDWDGRMTADSRGAVLANELRNCVANKIADDNKPVPAGIIRERIVERAIREKLDRWLPSGYSSDDQLFKACDDSSRASLADPKRLGPDPTTWTWGRIFQSRFPHPLATAPLIGMQFATPIVGLDGSGTTPDVGSNVSMRHIASPGNWDSTRHVIPLGESGDPQSPHFKDEFDAWRTGTPMIFPFTKAAVEKTATEVWILSPK